MTSTALHPLPGDILAVWTGNSLPDEAIRVGAVIEGQSGLNNHVVGMHHWTDGVAWGIEGKPGGVGWADITRYLEDPHTTHNIDQEKTLDERDAICKGGEVLLGTPYDWEAISDDTLTALHLPYLFNPLSHHDGWDGDVSNLAPTHVVCSSLWAYLYGK